MFAYVYRMYKEKLITEEKERTACGELYFFVKLSMLDNKIIIITWVWKRKFSTEQTRLYELINDVYNYNKTIYASLREHNDEIKAFWKKF